MKLRRWVVVCDRTGLIVSRHFSERSASQAAGHLSILSSVKFTEAKERLFGEPLTFSAHPAGNPATERGDQT